MLSTNNPSSFLPVEEEKKGIKLLLLCCLKELEIQENWITRINIRRKKGKKERERKEEDKKEK